MNPKLEKKIASPSAILAVTTTLRKLRDVDNGFTECTQPRGPLSCVGALVIRKQFECHNTKARKPRRRTDAHQFPHAAGSKHLNLNIIADLRYVFLVVSLIQSSKQVVGVSKHNKYLLPPDRGAASPEVPFAHAPGERLLKRQSDASRCKAKIWAAGRKRASCCRAIFICASLKKDGGFAEEYR